MYATCAHSRIRVVAEVAEVACLDMTFLSTGQVHDKALLTSISQAKNFITDFKALFSITPKALNSARELDA